MSDNLCGFPNGKEVMEVVQRNVDPARLGGKHGVPHVQPELVAVETAAALNATRYSKDTHYIFRLSMLCTLIFVILSLLFFPSPPPPSKSSMSFAVLPSLMYTLASLRPLITEHMPESVSDSESPLLSLSLSLFRMMPANFGAYIKTKH